MCKRFIFAIIVLLFFWQTGVAQNADDYLDRLERAESALKADFLVMQIWDAWTFPQETRAQHAVMRIGMEAMNANALDQAERIFTKILSATPDYTEAWNKRATVRFMKGDFVGSEADIYQVLIREPRHFGALAGLGMINMRLRDYEKALNAYERVKSINPFSTDANAIIPDLKDMLGIVDL